MDGLADMLRAERASHTQAQPVSVELLQELLDAHTDTVELLAGVRADDAWQGHLEYLRALHRHGTAVLARL